jgi:hypothetical protein
MFSRHLWWTWWIKEECIAQIRCLADNIENRILPAFDSVTEEANQIEEEAWRRFNEAAGPDADPAAGAEHALNQGLDHYTNLANLEQGMLNFAAAYCYHLFEQQFFYFHRKELLTQQEENDQRLYKHEEIRKRFEERGIFIQGFKAWPKIDDLRLVANVVKHADGPASEELRQRRPDMFIRPDVRNNGLLGPLLSFPLPVFQPLFGQGFYVTIEDFRMYAAAVVNFWTELADLLEQQ